MNLSKLTLERVFIFILHSELDVTAVLMKPTPHDYIVHHVAEDAVHLLELEWTFTSMRASLIRESPSVYALLAEGTLT